MWVVLLFVTVPLGFSILAITFSMIIVYRAVHIQAQKAKKWRLGSSGTGSTLEREVFWQCLWYCVAFYVTWPVMFAVYLASVDVNGPLALTLTVAFVAPLQGFSNWLVYVRPKLKRLWGDAASSRKAGIRWSVFRFITHRSAVTIPTTQLADNTDHSERGNGHTKNEDDDADMDPSALLPRRQVATEENGPSDVLEPQQNAMDEQPHN